MSSKFPKRQRIEWGTQWEPLLMPFLSQYLNEPILKTEYTFSLLDFLGQKSWAELKVRSSDYHYSHPKIREEGWLIPACKIKKASVEYGKKEIYFFYLWESDCSLWVYKYRPEDFEGLAPKIPRWHLDKQPHFYIPESKWELIDFLKIDCPTPTRKCLITNDD